jgi:rhodanese-related sulfurtransferase
MQKKFQVLFALLLAFSLILSACGAPAVATEAPVVAPPAEAPAAEVPPAPATLDLPTLLEAFWATVPPEKAFGSISVAKLNEQLVEKPAFLVDVREPAELEASGYIAGAINLPVRGILQNLDKLPGLDEPMVIYCASGHRGGIAMMALRMLGYTNVINLNGGTNAWGKAGLPLEKGGLPAEAASISAPIIADKILFETLNDFISNLPADKGFYTVKADKATEFIIEKAPFIVDVRAQADWDKDGYIEGATLIPFPEFLKNLDKLPADKNASILIYCASGHRGGMALMALRMLGYADVINLNGGLNAWKAAKLPVVGWVDWPVTYAEFLTNLPADQGFYSVKADKLNEMLADKPPFIVDVREPGEIETNGYITGSINLPIRTLLQNLDKLPAQDQKIVITCASGHRGSLGMVALRLLGYTDVVNLNGGINAWKKAEFALETGAPAAPAAGTAPQVDAVRLAYLDAYLSGLPEGFGAVKAPDFNTELAGGATVFLLDVRTQAEWDADGHIEGSVLVPVTELPANLDKLPADKAAPLVVLCKSGHRGGMAQMYLQSLGYTNIRNLNGGLGAWIAAELPVAK